jgi:nicotinamidase-related amidase
VGRREAFEQAIRLEPGRTALLIVDMQRAFVDAGESLEVPPARDVVPRIQALLALFREKSLPIVFTRFVYSPGVPLLVGQIHPSTGPPSPASRGASAGRRRRAWRAATTST